MTKRGMEAAVAYGRGLKKFKNRSEAEIHYRALCRSVLDRLVTACRAGGEELNYTAESLKRLEQLYFSVVEDKRWAQLDIDQRTFEMGMGVYWGEALVRNDKKWRWVLEGFPFKDGAWEVGVTDGHVTVLGLEKTYLDHYKARGNRQRQALLQQFKRYVHAAPAQGKSRGRPQKKDSAYIKQCIVKILTRRRKPQSNLWAALFFGDFDLNERTLRRETLAGILEEMTRDGTIVWREERNEAGYVLAENAKE